MPELWGFISSLLDGAVLLALALVLGGIGSLFAVLRVTHDNRPILHASVQRILLLTLVSAVCLIGLRTLQLLLTPLALADVIEGSVLTAFVHTQVFQDGAVSVVLALGILGALCVVKGHLVSRGRWVGVLCCVGAFLIHEGWFSHAVSRLEGGGSLMVVTIIHVLGATVWAGGVAHMWFLWIVLRKQDTGLWSELVSRFSPWPSSVSVLSLVPGCIWHGNMLEDGVA